MDFLDSEIGRHILLHFISLLIVGLIILFIIIWSITTQSEKDQQISTFVNKVDKYARARRYIQQNNQKET